MPIAAAEALVLLLQAYAAAGVVFAVLFLTRGVARIDPLAVAAPWTFRALIAPGVTLFWPLLLTRWALGSVAPPVEVNAHRRRARRQR